MLSLFRKTSQRALTNTAPVGPKERTSTAPFCVTRADHNHSVQKHRRQIEKNGASYVHDWVSDHKFSQKHASIKYS